MSQVYSSCLFGIGGDVGGGCFCFYSFYAFDGCDGCDDFDDFDGLSNTDVIFEKNELKTVPYLSEIPVPNY